MNRFSKREKVLIYIMVLVAIVIGSVSLLIVPQKKKLDSAESKRDDLRMQRQTFISEIYLTETYRTAFKSAQNDIKKIEGSFFNIMPYENIEKLFTDMISANGLEHRSVRIAEVKKEAEGTDKDNEEKEETAEPQEVKNPVTTISICFEAYGSFESANNLLKTVTDDKRLSLQSYSVSEQGGGYCVKAVVILDMVEKQ